MKRRKVFRFLGLGLAAGMMLIALFGLAVNYSLFGRLPGRKELTNIKNETASLIYTSEGKLIGKFFARDRTNVSYEEFPSHLIQALVATEDARYFEHKGVDSRSLIRVFFKTILLQDRGSGGGSTLTQQLAKNVYGRERFGPLTIPVNKTKEALVAYRLENTYNKEEILTLYLNTIPFGENVYGIEAAARRFFNKTTRELNMQESAILVGMLKANTYYNPRLHPENAIERRNVVFGQMVKYGYLDESALDSLTALPLELDYANLEAEGPANYFLVQVKKEAKALLETIERETGKSWNLETDGLVITSTLNLELQKSALKAFQAHLKKMQNKLRRQYQSGKSKRQLESMANRKLKRSGLSGSAEVKSRQEIFDWAGSYTDSISVMDSLKCSLTLLHAGLLALDPATGAIKAWVGGIDYRTQPYDQVMAHRQLASTFKPVLYAAALENGMEPCDYINNDPLTFSDYEDWSPENYDHSKGGKYSLTGALVSSMNLPTVRVFFDTGYENLESLWEKMGFTRPLHSSPSVALGTAEASIHELSVAYAAFANGGFKIEPSTILSIETTDGLLLYKNEFLSEDDRILEPRSSTWMNVMLSKAIRSGTGAAMKSTYGIDLPLAGKTGTSQNYSDAWFVAYNPKLLMVTRVGASSPSIHFNSGADGSGSALALPLVALTLKGVQEDVALRREIAEPFAPLPRHLQAALGCDDYKEETALSKFFDHFKPDKTTSKKQLKKAERKRKKREKRKKKRS